MIFAPANVSIKTAILKSSSMHFWLICQSWTSIIQILFCVTFF